ILVGGLLVFARPPLAARALTIVAGGSAAFVLWGLTLWKWSRTPSASASLLATIVLWTPDGYLHKVDFENVPLRVGAIRDRPTLLPGHGLLTLLTIVTFVAYFAFGIGKYLKVVGTVPMDASPLALPAIPTLACILVLVTLAVYVTAGLAFLLDRFRVPIFLPLIALALASSDWPQSDNYFAVHAMPEGRLGVPPDRALSARGGDLAIVVTASGGGVHAAAWTASVVAQLEQQFGARFHQSIRLISAVSGGSVGTMYIVNA